MAELPKKMEGKELAILFPEKVVDIGGGVEVIIRPLPLSKLEKVLDAFANLMQLAQAGVSPVMIISNAAKDIATLLPYCINRNFDELPATAAPILMRAVIDLNFTEDVLGNWKALVEAMGVIAPQQAPPDQGNSNPPLPSA